MSKVTECSLVTSIGYSVRDESPTKHENPQAQRPDIQVFIFDSRFASQGMWGRKDFSLGSIHRLTAPLHKHPALPHLFYHYLGYGLCDSAALDTAYVRFPTRYILYSAPNMGCSRI